MPYNPHAVKVRWPVLALAIDKWQSEDHSEPRSLKDLSRKIGATDDYLNGLKVKGKSRDSGVVSIAPEYLPGLERTLGVSRTDFIAHDPDANAPKPMATSAKRNGAKPKAEPSATTGPTEIAPSALAETDEAAAPTETIPAEDIPEPPAPPASDAHPLPEIGAILQHPEWGIGEVVEIELPTSEYDTPAVHIDVSGTAHPIRVPANKLAEWSPADLGPANDAADPDDDSPVRAPDPAAGADLDPSDPAEIPFIHRDVPPPPMPERDQMDIDADDAIRITEKFDGLLKSIEEHLDRERRAGDIVGRLTHDDLHADLAGDGLVSALASILSRARVSIRIASLEITVTPTDRS